jgi:predicted AAA+ superfamily ATPase
LKRVQEEYLEKWLNKKSRKPLVIRGARQVGKSTLVRNFATAENLNIFEVNLERNLKLTSLFDAFDLSAILNEIENICGKQGVLGNNSVLFLDEIQAIPSAIAALRYFYEDYPDLRVIAAGSLLELVLSNHSFSMPVGRIEYLFMGPMTFEEFLTAKKEDFLLNYIRTYRPDDLFSATVHDKIIHLLKDYFIIGGMPEAVQSYIDESSYEETSFVHTSIVETYIDDFAKYAKGKMLQTLQKVFRYVGSSPGIKTKYSNIDPDTRSRELKSAIGLLEKANVIFPVYHSSASGIPLISGKQSKTYKLFFMDIGLMNKICGIPQISIEEIKRVDFINKGSMAEQFIAQHLFGMGGYNESPQLFYWLRENTNNNAELDFVIQHNARILPVEVKAGAKGSLKSLHRFAYEKKSEIAVRFDLNPPSIQDIETRIANSTENENIHYRLLSLPIYMVEQMKRLLQSETETEYSDH